jgi:tetratricopeptide (TPR) repeat protein
MPIKIHMNKYIKSLMILFLLGNTVFSHAQAQDTLALAKKWNESGKFHKASSILSEYYPNHTQDLYAGWLYALSLHQSGKFAKSQKIYEHLTELFPNNYDLRLDRINKLAESGRFNQVLEQIEIEKASFPLSYQQELLNTKAKILFWQGDYDKALKNVNAYLAVNPNDGGALSLKKRIGLARRAWLNFDYTYFGDDQPMIKNTPSFRYQYYINSNLTAGAYVDMFFYGYESKSELTNWTKVNATYRLFKSNVIIKAEIGNIYYSTGNNALTGLLSVTKGIIPRLSVTAYAERAPYLATTFSVDDKVMATQGGISLDWKDDKGFMGRLSYDISLFPEVDNSYYTISGWFVSPSLKIKNLGLRLGYGYNFSTSEENTFVPKHDLDYIESNWTEGYQIEGVYNPFFSPQNQQVHSIIGLVNYNLNSRINLGFDMGYGFVGEADSPVLYLNKDEKGKNFVDRGYYRVSYHPLYVNTFFSYKFTDRLDVKLFYKHQETFYYQSNFLGISSRIVF